MRHILMAGAALALQAAPGSVGDAGAAERIIVAQAGSTGGTLGKSGRSVSGGEAAPPPESQAPPVKLAPSGARLRPATSAVVSFAGDWRLVAKCSNGDWNMRLVLQQAPGEGLSGTGHNLTAGYNSVVADGKVSGSQANFSLRWPAGVTDHWTARLAGSQMSGSIKGPFWTCTYAARRQ
jgi:hypothetical protein